MASKVVIDSNSWPKIGVVGCGTIVAAVVEGLCRLGKNPPENHFVPSKCRGTSKLASSFPSNTVLSSNQQVIDESDVIIIGLRTQVAKDVLSELTFHNNGTLQVVTLTSVFSVDQMAEMVGLPVDRVAKAVPLPAVHHRGITVTTGKPAINERIFSQLGGCQPVAMRRKVKVQVMTRMMGPIYKFMNVCADFMVEQDVLQIKVSQYVAKCGGYYTLIAEQRCSKGTAGFAELVDEQTPGGLESNISDLVDAGVFDAYKVSENCGQIKWHYCTKERLVVILR